MRLLVLLLSAAALGRCQQPFLTDDADVAPKHHFHLEVFSEFDRLQSSSYPALRQSTSRVQVTYGVTDNLEVGVDGPLIWIGNDRNAAIPNARGFGDLDLQMKYRILREHDGSRLPALTLALYIETPTGDPENQLGSGLADYWLNGILQKTLSRRFVWRVNGGLLFSGNTLTGAIGIREAHGKVITGASSISYQANSKWLVGTEVAGALTEQFDLGKGQLQMLVGAKYFVAKAVSFDFAVTAGKFEGSPRVGAACGISVDF